MSHSKIDLQTIKPEMPASVDAWFTLKNAHLNKESEIRGLNLGSNTPQPAEKVEANRKRLFEDLRIDGDWFADAKQVHGTKVQVVSQGGTYAETDGLITQIPGLTLSIQVADCAAVLLSDPSEKVVAAVHAGWRGAVGGIVENAIEQMEGLGAKAEEMHAFISPCISLSKFEVGNEVAELFPDSYVDYKSYQKPHIDLKGFLISRLTGLGLLGQNIEAHEGCTMAEADNYYSYRREGEAAGRMMGIIRIKE